MPIITTFSNTGLGQMQLSNPTENRGTGGSGGNGTNGAGAKGSNGIVILRYQI